MISHIAPSLLRRYLPSLDHVRHCIAPDAHIIPSAIEVHVALVHSDELARLNSVPSSTDPAGFDLTAINALSHRARAVRLAQLQHQLLSQPTVAVRMALNDHSQPLSSGEVIASLEVRRSGLAHAVVVWHTPQLTDEAQDESSPPPPSEDFISQLDGRQLCYYLFTPTADDVDWTDERKLLDSLIDEASTVAQRAQVAALPAALALPHV